MKQQKSSINWNNVMLQKAFFQTRGNTANYYVIQKDQGITEREMMHLHKKFVSF